MDLFQGSNAQVGELDPDVAVIERGSFDLVVDTPGSNGFYKDHVINFDTIFKQVMNPDVIMWYYTDFGPPTYRRQLVKCPVNLVDTNTGATKFNVSFNLDWSQGDPLSLYTTAWIRTAPETVTIFYVVTARSIIKSNVLSPI